MKLALDWMKDRRAHVVGREKESSSLNNLLFWGSLFSRLDRVTNVISVWGIAGVGKSTLVKDVYYTAVLEPLFERCGWVDVSHSQPFDLREFCRSLLSDIFPEYLEAKKNGRFGLLVSDHLFSGSREALLKQKVESLEAGMLGFKDPIEVCCKLLHEERCLVVIDGLRSTEEWDLIKAALVTPGAAEKGTCIMVIATEESVATHCSVQAKNVYNVKCLDAATALDLFEKEVFKNKEIPHLATDMEEQAKLLVDKCGGLPKVIVAIGGFLARRKTAVKWRELNDSFMHELETNPRLDSLRGLFTWMHCYFRTCPDYIKPCIFYLSIFPAAGESTSIRRRRLVRRWIAEGYSRDMDRHTAEEKGETFFSELVGLSIIQQPPETATATYTHNKRMVSCQVNGFFREYISTRPMEDNLVFALEGSCSVGATQCRHLAIRTGWNRDRNVYESMDFSRLRSLTVFGEWRPFFVTKEMRVLQVLDLEDTEGLKDDDLEQLGKLVPRLKFLSVRGCREIHRLPDSLGGLTQLQTLEARNTSVSMLPTVIVKLQKLQYLRAGAVPLDTVASPPPPSSRWISWLPMLRRHPRPAAAGPHVGVEVPRGGIVGKMTTLHTLGVVDVSVAAGQGKAVLKELKNLTQLRKLGVSGINPANSKELWSAISGHRYLESLSVRLEDAGGDQGIYGCSDGTVFSPPEKLQSLKLHGLVGKLPAWIKQLQNLSKLNLHITILAQEALPNLAREALPNQEQADLPNQAQEDLPNLAQEDIYILGDLPNLRILRLCLKPVQDGNLHFSKRPEESSRLSLIRFKYLEVLEIACNSRLQEVIFGRRVMGNLELLKVRGCSGPSGSALRFSGLLFLRGIKRIFLKDCGEEVRLRENVKSEIAHLRPEPDLKIEYSDVC